MHAQFLKVKNNVIARPYDVRRKNFDICAVYLRSAAVGSWEGVSMLAISFQGTYSTENKKRMILTRIGTGFWEV